MSPPASSRDGLLHDPGRKPKKTKAAKKTQVSYQVKEENPNQENPVSRRLAATRFRLAATVNTQNESKQALNDLAQWLKEDDHPAEDDSGYAVTPTFQQLQTLFAHAHDARSLLAITGSWGIGKTQAAQYYAAKNPRTHTRPGAVRIQFDRTDCKPVAALEKIRDALNANPGSHRRGNVMKAIGKALRLGDFLILEECQRLGEALDVICSLHDDFDVGIAMIGNPELTTAVWGKRTAFGALASRANR
ncbi:MAG: AAA family ATPase, partial [Rhodospirillales bacterium]|nr:AAA family ATPase [Rhodospirillales bacterium]